MKTLLKNPKLLSLLRPADHPDGDPLHLEGQELIGAGWPVPVMNGVPDFVMHAPPVKRSVTFDIPIEDKPTPDVLTTPSSDERSPSWFGEEGHKYGSLKEHRKGFLLDAGCGKGNRTTFETLGYDYIGLDNVFDSNQREEEQAPDVDVMADCHRLPFPSDSMEVVNITAVLEHLYCPILAIQEMTRVLRPGGLLTGSCSFLEGEHFDSQCHYSWLGLYRLLKTGGIEVRHLYPGLSLWEMHSNSLYFSLPGHPWMGKLHRKLYLGLVGLKSRESPQMRLLRHAAILHFVAFKPSCEGRAPAMIS